MIQLVFNVSGQVLKRIDETKIVSDTIGQFEAVFTFDAWWDNYTPTVQFIKNSQAYDCLLENNRCFVPPEAMEKGGVFYVSVFATEDANRKTANAVAIKVDASGYNPKGSHSISPTPTVIEQLLKKVENIKSYIANLAEKIPDDISIEDNIIALLLKGQKIGEGAKLPKITVDSELSADSENPVQNRAVLKAIENSKPMLITFNNADFENTDSQQFPIGISFVLSQSSVILTAAFDVSRLNFIVPEGADVIIHKVLIEGEAFDLSLLDKYIKSSELFSYDYGEGWLIEDNQYMYLHEYSFSTPENAQTAFDDLQESINLTGFQLLVNNYNQITAREV